MDFTASCVRIGFPGAAVDRDRAEAALLSRADRYAASPLFRLRIGHKPLFALVTEGDDLELRGSYGVFDLPDRLELLSRLVGAVSDAVGAPPETAAGNAADPRDWDESGVLGKPIRMAHAMVWTRVREGAVMPYEWPLGLASAGPERCVAFVEVPRAISPTGLRGALGNLGGGREIQDVSAGAFLVYEGTNPAVKAWLRPDGTIQLWPAWGALPFMVLGPAVLRAAETVASSLEGRATLDGVDIADRAARTRLHGRLMGAAVDF